MIQRRLLLLSFLCLIWLAGHHQARAQTYFTGNVETIPNDGVFHFYTIDVTNASQVYLYRNFGLNRVCINITHPEVSDLVIRVGPPTPGTDFILSDLTGQRGANFDNTCFSMRATRSVLNGIAPFTGTFISQELFSRVNHDSLPANGTWYIAIKNTSATAAGTFNGASISLDPNPAPDPAFVPLCGMQNAGYCHCPDGSDTCDLLPDMTTSEMIIADQHSVDGDSLRISNATPNIGWGPLETHGTAQCYCDTARVPCSAVTCPGGDPPKERVVQRIYRKQGNTMVTRDREMGFMQYHPSHGHVHVDGWAIYTLRVKNNNPDPRQWPIAATSGKRSYCLVNFSDCSANLGYCVDAAGRTISQPDIKNFGFGTVTGCARDQGIFVGSLDIYAAATPGQAIPLAGICGGDYYIVSETDPGNIVQEISHVNNVAAVPIRLTRPGSGTVPNFDIASSDSYYMFQASNLPAGTQYVWNFGDGMRDSTSNPAFHLYPQAGTYTISLTYKGQSCGNVTTTQTVAITSVSPKLPAASFALQVQPNPVQGQASIAFNLPAVKGSRVFILNPLGQRITSFEESSLKPGANSIALGRHLAPGLYTAVLETSLGRATTKFIVE